MRHHQVPVAYEPQTSQGNIAIEHSPSQEPISVRSVEIATIVFSQEIELFRLQARSIARNLCPTDIGCLHIILNEPDPGPINYAVSKIVEDELGVFGRLTKIWQASDLAIIGTWRGWYTQQLLKLKIARVVESPKYVVLDAKNHFIRQASVDDFISSDGRPYMKRSLYSGPLKDFFINSLRYFGIDPSVGSQLSMPAITPFTFYTDVVRDMILTVEEQEDQSFENFFLAEGRDVSEFSLYYAFFLKKGLSVEALYSLERSICVTLWKQWATSPEQQLEQLGGLRDDSIVLFGLHRNCIRHLSEESKEVVLEYWVRAKLFPDIPSATEFYKALEANV
jgi:hypothetical protein